MYIADLHIHSRFSRATSKDCDVPHLDWWARRKGIGLIGTGDFTHPAWRTELKEQLVMAEEGVYTLRDNMQLSGALPSNTPRFVVTGEISSIYKRNGKTRKVHNLILLPSLEAADELSTKLEAIGNIHSDGRPILGLDSRDLLEITLDVCPDAEFIPAHIWTPHFSMFGAFSGFDTIQACFDDMAPHIHAVETGLSSDPPMNWRVSALDGLTLISNSDAHSPAKLGREANLLDTDLSYSALVEAIRTGKGFGGTVEFFPEEGKYHLDGHRNCGICFTPVETNAHEGRCPVCGKKLTIGVEHRVEELADRPARFCPTKAKPFESLVPLPEVISASQGGSASCKKTMELYEQMLRILGPEFYILREAPVEDVEQAAGPCVAEGIRRLRIGQVNRTAGFDGEYGTISLLTPAEREQFNGQISFADTGMAGEKRNRQHVQSKQKKSSDVTAFMQTSKQGEILNPAQKEAVSSKQRVIAVVAGPGTGKTKTLVSRIAYLVEELGVHPDEITAVTFTNKAAAEMRQRLEKRLGGKRVVARMTIGTFHAICLKLLGDVQLISRVDALTIAAEVLNGADNKGSAGNFLQAVSRIKNGVDPEIIGLDRMLYEAYCLRLQQQNLLDFDDLLTETLKLDVSTRRCFSYLLVDEFQDINDTQYALVQNWTLKSKSLFVIGDPDQSIYGFRGANGNCFKRLSDDCPKLQVIRLLENYRSTPEILHATLPVIDRNPGSPRHLSPNQSSGVKVRLVQAKDDFGEGIFIAKEIGRMTGGIDMLEAQNIHQERGTRSFSDIAVLCRTHRQLKLIEKCLQHDDIPCVISGRDTFLDADEVRGPLAFLRFLQAPYDGISVETALRLLWKCPEDLIGEIKKICDKQKELDPQALFEIAKENEILKSWLLMIEEWLPLMKREKPWKLIARWEEQYGASPALDALRNTAIFHASFQELWNVLILGEDADISRATGKSWESGAVKLMTLHGSKGLEFPAVFIAGVKEGMLPLESEGRPTDLEEERRLFYVGMTRAREELILTSSPEFSCFLQELPDAVAQETAARRERPAVQLSFF